MNNNQQPNIAGQKDDYLDKGFAAAQKKFHIPGMPTDPTKKRAMNEKITDGARSMFEKFTGKKVPAKFSN
ncbi:hypothetical protein B0A49_07529 [Cryomyces minteri]|uniref:Uncharacterized protein n=1 Tax=Cryomyces minteri TaxID=331657 RepID=A0A4V5NDH5_9PEZI|nr:hypothetical protein B0A49_07529 [Cryomyces minteri]